LPAWLATIGVKNNDLPNGTPSVFEGTASDAAPAASKTRAAHTPPIDKIGGRRQILYSYGTRNPRCHLNLCSLPVWLATVGMKTRDLPNGTPSVFEGTASEANPAASKTRAVHTPPIDIIGGRRQILHSYGTRNPR
jgi:hypothetical protein